MAQHDYDLVNAPPLTLRSEFNSVLEAVLSTNSGPLAPTTFYAGQLWFRSSDSTLWLRHSTNPVWTQISLDVAFLPLSGGVIAGNPAGGNLNVTGSFSNPDFDRLRVNYIGAAAPSTPLTGMLWYDTSVTPNVLRVRNKTNSAWLAALDMATPVFVDAMSVVASAAGNAHLVLQSQGVQRLIYNEPANDRLNFYLPTTSTAAALTDAGVLSLKGNGYASLAAAINGLQPALGYTPIQQTGAVVPAIGGNPPHLYRAGVDQGAIVYGPPTALLLERAAIGALTYGGPASGYGTVPADGTISGANLTYMPGRTVVGVGTWRNLQAAIAYADIGIFQRIA